MRRGLRILGAVAVVLAVLAVAGLVVFLNLPLRPPAGVASPSGTAPAPNIVRRLKGTVKAASGSAAQAQQPAVDLKFQTPSQGSAIVGCGYGQPAAPGAPSPLSPCTIIGTSDGGATWHREFSTKVQIGRLTFPSPADGFAWTASGYCPYAGCPTRIFATRDGGRTWALRYQGTKTLSSLAFQSGADAWAVAGGALLRSTDGARTWTQALSSQTCTFQQVSFKGPVGIAVGQGAQGVCAYRTNDGGVAWSPWIAGLQAPEIAPAFDTFIQVSGLAKYIGGPAKAAAACSAGSAQSTGGKDAWLTVVCNQINPDMLAVMHTADGGASWQLAWSTQGCAMGCQGMGGSESPLFFLGDAAWRAAPSGVSRSTDGARSWSTGGQLCTMAQCIPTLDFLSRERGFAATQSGVFATRDGGMSWTRIWPSSGPGQLAAVSLVNPKVGFAVPQLRVGSVLETTDLGRTWHSYLTAPDGLTLSAIDFLTSREGFLYGTHQGLNVLLYTGNGGRSFRPIMLPKGQFGTIQISQLAFTTPQAGLAMDDFGNAWRTADGGRHWTEVGSFPLGHPQQVAWASPHEAYATVFLKTVKKSAGKPEVTGQYGLVASSDGGKTWQPMAAWPWPPAKGQVGASVVAAVGTNIWLFGDSGVLRSTDAGRTWTRVNLPSSVQLYPTALTFADRTHGWLLSNGQLYATADGGVAWVQVALSR